jgi:hypothetical protein
MKHTRRIDTVNDTRSRHKASTTPRAGLDLRRNTHHNLLRYMIPDDIGLGLELEALQHRGNRSCDGTKAAWMRPTSGRSGNP